MIGNILNVAFHGCDSYTIINWALWRWRLDEQAKLLVITHNHDGDALDNRMRVALSNIRSYVRKSGIRDYKRFGISTQVIKWNLSPDVQLEALFIQRFVELRHTFGEVIASSPLDLTQLKETQHGRH